jgi:hypothetical protein
MNLIHVIERFLGNIIVMQNNIKKNQSQLIKNSEELKIKTKRRLIGSIVLLLIALFIILNIANKNNNHKNNIDIKVIKNNESILNKPFSSINMNNHAVIPVESKLVESKLVESKIILTEAEKSNKLDNHIQSIVTKNTDIPDNINVNDNHHNKHSFNPKIIIEKENINNNPNDILDNITVNKKIFYIQFIALENKEKILLEKKYLQKLGIKSYLSQVKIKNKIFYRLRSNSFINKEKALEYLHYLNNKLD